MATRKRGHEVHAINESEKEAHAPPVRERIIYKDGEFLDLKCQRSVRLVALAELRYGAKEVKFYCNACGYITLTVLKP